MTVHDQRGNLSNHVDLRPIVVGVDGSVHNQSAIAWGAAEARRSGRLLELVSSSDDYVRQVPMYSANLGQVDFESHASRTLTRVQAHLEVEHHDVKVVAVAEKADPTTALVERSDDAALVVVGKRGVGAFERVMVGSTSIGVAGRAACPTVVVPDSWDQSLAFRQPVVLAVDVDRPGDHPAVRFAFERAHALEVPLVALYAWQTHPAVTLTQADREEWAEQARAALGVLVTPWQAKYPDVRVEMVQIHEQAALAILEKSALSQLVVVGRHTRSHRTTGLGFGSVVRAVLHYTTTPVAVVPE